MDQLFKFIFTFQKISKIFEVNSWKAYLHRLARDLCVPSVVAADIRDQYRTYDMPFALEINSKGMQACAILLFNH